MVEAILFQSPTFKQGTVRKITFYMFFLLHYVHKIHCNVLEAILL